MITGIEKAAAALKLAEEEPDMACLHEYPENFAPNTLQDKYWEIGDRSKAQQQLLKAILSARKKPLPGSPYFLTQEDAGPRPFYSQWLLGNATKPREINLQNANPKAIAKALQAWESAESSPSLRWKTNPNWNKDDE